MCRLGLTICRFRIRNLLRSVSKNLDISTLHTANKHGSSFGKERKDKKITGALRLPATIVRTEGSTTVLGASFCCMNLDGCVIGKR